MRLSRNPTTSMVIAGVDEARLLASAGFWRGCKALSFLPALRALPKLLVWQSSLGRCSTLAPQVQFIPTSISHLNCSDAIRPRHHPAYTRNMQSHDVLPFVCITNAINASVTNAPCTMVDIVRQQMCLHSRNSASLLSTTMKGLQASRPRSYRPNKPELRCDCARAGTECKLGWRLAPHDHSPLDMSRIAILTCDSKAAHHLAGQSPGSLPFDLPRQQSPAAVRGDPIMAIGSPFGVAAPDFFSNMVVSGIIARVNLAVRSLQSPLPPWIASSHSKPVDQRSAGLYTGLSSCSILTSYETESGDWTPTPAHAVSWFNGSIIPAHIHLCRLQQAVNQTGHQLCCLLTWQRCLAWKDLPCFPRRASWLAC